MERKKHPSSKRLIATRMKFPKVERPLSDVVVPLVIYPIEKLPVVVKEEAEEERTIPVWY